MLITLKEDLIVPSIEIYIYIHTLDGFVKNIHFNILEFTTLP